MPDQMMSDAKKKKYKEFKKVKTADDFIKKWHVWFKGHEEVMRQDLMSVVENNKVARSINKTDIIGL